MIHRSHMRDAIRARQPIGPNLPLCCGSFPCVAPHCSSTGDGARDVQTWQEVDSLGVSLPSTGVHCNRRSWHRSASGRLWYREGRLARALKEEGAYCMALIPEIVVTNLALSLEPAENGNPPLQPLVIRAHLKLDDSGLDKIARVVLAKARDRVPVDVLLQSAKFQAGGLEINAQVSKGRFMKADVRAVVRIAATGSEQITVEVQDVKALGMLPLDAFIAPMLERAFAMASSRPGIARSSSNARALLIDPAEVLRALGMPLRFAAGGTWTVHSVTGALEVAFGTAH